MTSSTFCLIDVRKRQKARRAHHGFEVHASRFQLTLEQSKRMTTENIVSLLTMTME